MSRTNEFSTSKTLYFTRNRRDQCVGTEKSAAQIIQHCFVDIRDQRGRKTRYFVYHVKSSSRSYSAKNTNSTGLNYIPADAASAHFTIWDWVGETTQHYYALVFASKRNYMWWWHIHRRYSLCGLCSISIVKIHYIGTIQKILSENRWDFLVAEK